MNSLLELFLVFLKIGVTTFGGGYAMISNIKEEIVDKKKWITNEELLNVVAVGETTPGPIAINMATYVGYRRGKLLGAIIATLGVIIPSFLIILGITYIFKALLTNKLFTAAFNGIKIGVAILIVRAGISLLKQTKLKPYQYAILISVFVISVLIDVFSWNISVILLTVAGGIIGLSLTLLSKDRKEKL